MHPKIKFINTFFGKYPYYINAFIKTFQYNSNYELTIFTDNVLEVIIDKNITYKPYTLQQFNKDLSIFLGDVIDIEPCSDLTETRPLFGEFFKEELQGYDFWGHIDLDILCGDFDRFLYPEAFKYDIITNKCNEKYICGPFTLYRNILKINQLYKLIPDYVKKLQTKGVVYIHDIHENEFGKIIHANKINVTYGNLNKNNQHIPFMRNGKRYTPSYWENGKVYVHSYRIDYPGQSVFDGYYNETLLIHHRPKKTDRVTRDMRVYNKYDNKYVTHTNVYIKDAIFSFTQQQSFLIFDKLILVDLQDDNTQNYDYFIKIYPGLLEFKHFSAHILFRNKNTKNIIQKFSKHFIQNLKILFPNFTLIKRTNKCFMYKTLLHVQKLKPSHRISLDIEHLKTCLLKVKEPKDFNVYENLLITNTNVGYISSTLQNFLINEKKFTSLCLDEFTISQQAKLFDNAQTIIAVHSDALANIIFCKKTARVFLLNFGNLKNHYTHLKQKTDLNTLKVIDGDVSYKTQKTPFFNIDLKHFSKQVFNSV